MKSELFVVIFQVNLIISFTHGVPAISSSWRDIKTSSYVKEDFNKIPLARKGLTDVLADLNRRCLLGLALGTLKVERKMEENILKLFSNLINSNLNKTETEERMRKIETIMMRDKISLKILKDAINLGLQAKTKNDLRESKSETIKDDVNLNYSESSQRPMRFIGKEFTLNNFTKNLNNHMRSMQMSVGVAVDAIKTLTSMNNKQEIGSTLLPSTIAPPTVSTRDNYKIEIFRLPGYSNLLGYQSYLHSLDRFRRQNQKVKGMKENQENSEEENFDDGFNPQENNGGIAGLIASLSSSEGGSDVGALVGAISGVVTNLFGPGGLDVPSLLSTGTSLLAGLLGGDENFGKVLASYVGISVEGLSGGGGADNNGLFFGNFLGTLLGYLSADPNEEEGPQPKLFFDNFFKGFEQTKQKRGAENETNSHNKGYFFEFISKIVSSLVGGLTNLILNASLGSSGGSSQGSADLSAGSSQGSHAGSAYASQSSSVK